jgi:hypothetical protein
MARLVDAVGAERRIGGKGGTIPPGWVDEVFAIAVSR